MRYYYQLMKSEVPNFYLLMAIEQLQNAIKFHLNFALMSELLHKFVAVAGTFLDFRSYISLKKTIFNSLPVQSV